MNVSNDTSAGDGAPGYPLSALAAFDAAARHGSFTVAARELGIGQPAISHAVRRLETELATPLFRRLHRGVELTDSGRVLADAVRAGLATIADGIDELRRRRQEGGGTVTIGTSTATAVHWLIPRLARFKLTAPSIDVQCITSDTNSFDLESLDLFIPIGRGTWPHRNRWPVARELVYPICSPGFARTLGALPVPVERLRELPLLHVQERHRSRLTWSQWFAAVGVDAPSERGATVANDYTVLLQAVQAGHGVALGWHHIVADLVTQGAVVRPVAEQVESGRLIYLHAPPGRGPSAEVDAVREWLVGDARVDARRLRGSGWDGDLEEMRAGRTE